MSSGRLLERLGIGIRIALSLCLVIAAVAAPRPTTAQTMIFQMPVEPVAPTDMRQCHELDQQYQQIVMAILQEIAKAKGPVTVEPTPACKSARQTVTQGTGPLHNQECMIRRQREQAVQGCRTEVMLNRETDALARRTVEDAARELAERRGFGAELGVMDQVKSAWAKWKSRYQLAKDVADLGSGKASWLERYDIIARNVENAGSALPFNPLVKAFFGEALEQIVAVHKDTQRQLDETVEEIGTLDTNSRTNRSWQQVVTEAKQAAREVELRQAELDAANQRELENWLSELQNERRRNEAELARRRQELARRQQEEAQRRQADVRQQRNDVDAASVFLGILGGVAAGLSAYGQSPAVSNPGAAIGGPYKVCPSGHIVLPSQSCGSTNSSGSSASAQDHGAPCQEVCGSGPGAACRVVCN